MARKELYWVLVSLLLFGCSHQATTSEAKSAAAKLSTSGSELPTDGFVKDGIYTNRFFQFSMEFPQSWKIFDSGSSSARNGGPSAGLVPRAADSVEAGYSLFFAGTADKQTRNLHGVMISATKPTEAFALNATPENILRVQADAIKAVAAEYLKKGETPPFTAGEPTEFDISGRRVARLDETGEMNQKPAKFVILATDERGYLILFIFFDSTEDAANYQAAKEIGSLRFFARSN